MSWSEEAYRSVTSILEDIKAHPFIRELALGTLSKDKFSRYIAQDKIYLKGYAAEMEAISQMPRRAATPRCSDSSQKTGWNRRTVSTNFSPAP